MRSAVTVLTFAIALFGVAGCGLFGGSDDDEKLEPTELIEFEQTLPIRRLWSAKVGKGTEFLRLSLAPAGDGTRIYAAGHNGVVVAFDPENGRRLWSTDLGVELTAGPGVDGDLVVVAGREGDVICLRANDGAEVWRTNIDGESVALPLVKDDTVVIVTIDGVMRALSTFDGAIRWTIEQSLPALTLRGASEPVVVGTSVISGFDNGRLIAVGMQDGTVEWESVLSPPSGRSDLERLADVDGAIASVGQDIYAAGYQGRIAALAAESGQILWAREVSTHAGIGADWDKIYTVTGDGEVLAMTRRNGEDEWRQAILVRRQPTTPVPFNTAVAVGDFEGYVHLFDNADGAPVARVRVGKGMISTAPVVIAGRLYVQNESGEIAAFDVEQPERPDVETDEEPAEET